MKLSLFVQIEDLGTNITQNMLRLHEGLFGEEEKIRFVTALDTIKCLKLIK